MLVAYCFYSYRSRLVCLFCTSTTSTSDDQISHLKEKENELIASFADIELIRLSTEERNEDEIYLISVSMKGRSDPFIFSCQNLIDQNNVANLIDGYSSNGLTRILFSVVSNE